MSRIIPPVKPYLPEEKSVVKEGLRTEPIILTIILTITILIVHRKWKAIAEAISKLLKRMRVVLYRV